MKIVPGWATIITMKKYADQQGSAMLMGLVIAFAALFVLATGVGVWAFMSRQDYKNNSDAKVTTAVAANTQKVQADDKVKYDEEAKSPLTTYVGPEAYGSVHLSYPKTWSAYVVTNSSSAPLDAYFHASYVPGLDTRQPYQLRVQVVDRAYDKELDRYKSAVKSGSAQAAAYSLPKVPKVVGTRLTGTISPDSQPVTGSLVLLPLRDKTLAIWAESNDYLNDFNTYVLPNVTFSP